MNEDIRWLQSLRNFSKAIALLREIVHENEDILALPAIVKEGTIQRFEYTFELAWKTLKAKIEYDGLAIETGSPRYVFKLAAQKSYINNLEQWLNMIGDRNLMSHTYDPKKFDLVLQNLKLNYMEMLDELYARLIELSL